MSGVQVVLISVIAFFSGFLMGMLVVAWGEFSRQYPDHSRVRSSRWGR